MTTEPAPTGQVGRSIPRLEAHAKVTGRAEYIHNLRLPGMLYGKIFRSIVPHGRIRHIDTSAACAVEGVHSIITVEDVRRVVPAPYYGPAFHDQPILADGKVRFVGEPVAVVLAEDRRVAEEASGLITAEYEELPTIDDEVKATCATVFVHDELKPSAIFADLQHLKGRRATNVALDYHLQQGDAEAAFAAAERVFETGEQIIAAPRQKVWEALNDPEILKQCISGCEEILRNSLTEFTAKVQVKVEPIRAKFAGKLSLLELDPPNGYRISGQGAGGIAGFAKGSATVRLADVRGGTKLSYNVTVQVGGKLAQIGSRLIDSTAQRYAEDFFCRFSAILSQSADATLPSVWQRVPLAL